MPSQQQETAIQSISREDEPAAQTFIGKWLDRLLVRGMGCGPLLIKTPRGKQILIAYDGRSAPSAQLTIHRPWKLFWRLLTGWDLGFAESYMAGDWSTPNLVALLKLACSQSWGTTSIGGVRPPSLALRLRHALNRNTKRGSRRNIAAHYDLGNGFYEQWLDPGMTYSSALFATPSETLETAQQFKQDRIIDLLALSGGEDVLEIGFGWGGLAERMLERHECALTGLTLSSEQIAYARTRLRDHIAAGKCALRLQDYRDAGGTYDRIVSVEMLEAVGEAYWPVFFSKLKDRLRPHGVAVLQVITIRQEYFAFYRRHPDFIQKYVFPGGMLPTPEIIDREAAQAGLQVVQSEFFGDSYAKTIAEWTRRFQRSWPSIQAQGFDLRFKRMWDYYLGYCQAGFEAGIVTVGLYKITHGDLGFMGQRAEM
jgi:cyclopropane-fatty-acyl-phospholipid synthase